MRKVISNNKFLNGLYQYRLIIFAIFFVIVVPFTFLLFLYLGNFLKYKTVSFNDNVSSSHFRDMTYYEEKSNFEADLSDFTIIVEPTRINLPKKEVEEKDGKKEEKLINGSYVFNIYYDNKNSDIQDINANLVLQTQWIDAKSTLTNRSLVAKNGSSYSKQMTISYNYDLPKRTLLFVTVKRPDLYILLTYKKTDFNIEQQVFLKVNLQETPIDIR